MISVLLQSAYAGFQILPTAMVGEWQSCHTRDAKATPVRGLLNQMRFQFKRRVLHIQVKTKAPCHLFQAVLRSDFSNYWSAETGWGRLNLPKQSSPLHWLCVGCCPVLGGIQCTALRYPSGAHHCTTTPDRTGCFRGCRPLAALPGSGRCQRQVAIIKAAAAHLLAANYSTQDCTCFSIVYHVVI